MEEKELIKELRNHQKRPFWKIERAIKLSYELGITETKKKIKEVVEDLDIELFLEEVVDVKTGKKEEIPKEIWNLWDVYWEHIKEKLLKQIDEK